MALFRRKSREYMAVRMGNPRARTDDLVVEEFEDEVLVYDGKNHQAHSLASAAAKVWRACDGTKDVPALAESLALSVDDVTRALEMLDGVELLENQGLQIVTNGDGNGNGLTRRELGRRSAKVGAAAAAAPMLYSIVVPSPAAAATPTNLACALFSTNSCGTSYGAAAVAGCCCCCQGGGDCKIGGASRHVQQLSTCPDGTEAGMCSTSCNPPQLRRVGELCWMLRRWRCHRLRVRVRRRTRNQDGCLCNDTSGQCNDNPQERLRRHACTPRRRELRRRLLQHRRPCGLPLPRWPGWHQLRSVLQRQPGIPDGAPPGGCHVQLLRARPHDDAGCAQQVFGV